MVTYDRAGTWMRGKPRVSFSVNSTTRAEPSPRRVDRSRRRRLSGKTRRTRKPGHAAERILQSTVFYTLAKWVTLAACGNLPTVRDRTAQ
jgi:hypothetical protein